MPLGISSNDWDALVREAANVPTPAGPKRLLALLSGRHDPFSIEDESQEEFHQALLGDFGSVYRYREPQNSLSKADQEIWIDRLAWLLKAMEACNLQRPRPATLAAILRTGSVFSFEEPIWYHLPTKYFGKNFLSSIAALIASTECCFSSRGGSEPLWEREAVDDFLRADSVGDWPRIERLWQSIVPVMRLDGDLAEATACLCATENGYCVLALALDELRSILTIASVANAMTPYQIGKIGTLVNSDRTRFVLVQSLAFNHPRNVQLADLIQDNLVVLFRRVQQNGNEWQKWMQAFNRYPVRTRAIQPAFGRSMVDSLEIAKIAYIEAVDLSTALGDSRAAVTTCLSEFCSAASLDERQAMWALAYNRWRTWDFAKNQADSSLVWMAVSELDFALIGYVVECMSDDELRAKLEALAVDLIKVQEPWYTDRVTFDSAWYRALSRWQIFSYAAGVRTAKYAWEAPQKVLMPFDPSVDRYCSISLGTNLPRGCGIY